MKIKNIKRIADVIPSDDHWAPLSLEHAQKEVDRHSFFAKIFDVILEPTDLRGIYDCMLCQRLKPRDAVLEYVHSKVVEEKERILDKIM